MIDFLAWPKTPRLNAAGSTTITEKIDGTNACVIIMPLDESEQVVAGDPPIIDVIEHNDVFYAVAAQSRKRLIFPGQDNAGFAAWVEANATELVDLLGSGRHFGEWWGQGIQRRYGMDRKVFSLFNVHRFQRVAMERHDWFTRAGDINMTLVPMLYLGPFSDKAVRDELEELRRAGSYAAAQWGFSGQKAEGVVIRHRELGGNLKAFIDNDDVPKGEQDVNSDFSG